VLAYLVRGARRPRHRRPVLEIGGPDVMTYRELMHAYAEVAGCAGA
jgi:uncharacterized protein YbjT (DUF2867 family)